jgi:hypothetical protein
LDEAKVFEAGKDSQTREGAAVQPLRLTVPGEYWDSQIYAGRLYLFERNGDIRTLDWDRLMAAWRIDPQLRIALECAFLRSDYLYGDRWSLLFSDQDIKGLILKKFSDLSEKQLEITSVDLEKFSLRRQKNPFPFPHTDTTIYRKNIFVVSSSGVHRASCNKANVNPISSRPEKRWDAPILAVDASYLTLALAAGNEGLYELPVSEDNYHLPSPGRDGARRIGKRNCTDCNWTFYSIYGSSHIDAGFLAAYRKTPSKDEGLLSSRDFEGLIPASKIFHNGHGYSWGNQDKLCQVSESTVRIVNYRPWEDEKLDRLSDLGTIDLATSGDVQTIQLSPWKGQVISGAVALFGTIIECESALVVVPSEGPTITLPGEVVNWRVFPRSVHYENQLHLIYDDKLEILSFNHDYFVDQDRKRSGIRRFHS